MKLTPEEQLVRFREAVERTGRSDDAASSRAKLRAEKLTPDEQRRRFEEAAEQAGASAGEADFMRR